MKLKSIFKALFSGRNHIIRRRPCQDYAAYRLSADGYPVLCLSDGAGGAKYSELASRSNVDAVLNYFQKNTVTDFIKLQPTPRATAIIDECVDYLNSVASRYEISDLDELSATLVFVIITDKIIYTGHIGDGIVVGLKKDGDLDMISEPENINGASNRTHFTCEHKARDYYNDNIINVDSYTSILLCSDGPYNDISPYDKLTSSFSSLLNDMDCGKISNNIDFCRRVSELSSIYDDWSIIAISIDQQQILESCTIRYDD